MTEFTKRCAVVWSGSTWLRFCQVLSVASRLRSRAGCKFGDSENPLLVSVRSGARARMPGMMDTVLNVGFNAKTVEERL